MREIALLLGMLSPMSVALAAQPSFDCAEASTEVEQLLCEDEELAALDRKLASLYTSLWEEDPEVVPPTALGLQSGQRSWVMSRDDCAKTEDMRGCVAQHYQFRIAELQALYDRVPAVDSVVFDCSGAQVVVSYFDTDPPTARLWRDGAAVVTYRVAAASGARYQGNRVEFWNQDSQARVDWEGEELVCVRVAAED